MKYEELSDEQQLFIQYGKAGHRILVEVRRQGKNH